MIDLSKRIIVDLRYNRKLFKLQSLNDIRYPYPSTSFSNSTRWHLTTKCMIDLSQLSQITCLLSHVLLFLLSWRTYVLERASSFSGLFSFVILRTAIIRKNERERDTLLYGTRTITDSFVVLFNNSIEIKTIVWYCFFLWFVDWIWICLKTDIIETILLSSLFR